MKIGTPRQKEIIYFILPRVRGHIANTEWSDITSCLYIIQNYVMNLK